MGNPKIKFIIDAKQDIKNYVLFKKYSLKYLKMFLPIELWRAKDKEILCHATEKFGTRSKDIEKNVKETKKLWNAVSKNFFELADEIFKNHPWPPGDYRAYASVFRMYPRNIKEKIFYFSALGKPEANLKTIAHEMLHFIFFDYMRARYGIRENKEFQNKNKKYVWNVSEVFNLVIETWRPYQKIFKTRGRPYDVSHARMLPKMKRIWKKNEDIDNLLDCYFKKIQ